MILISSLSPDQQSSLKVCLLNICFPFPPSRLPFDLVNEKLLPCLPSVSGSEGYVKEK